MHRLVAVSCVLALAACGLDDGNDPKKSVGPLDVRVKVPEAPDVNIGFQVVGPEYVIPKGTDQMQCWVPDVDITEDHLIKSFDARQGLYGHHLFGMKSAIPRQPGERFDCTTVDGMSTLEPLISPNTGNKEGTAELLSDDFAVRIPAGTQLIMQSHYVNYSDNDIRVRDVGIFTYLPDGEERIEASYLVLNDDQFNIPANGEHYAHSAECTMQHRFQFSAMHGHMHEWGKHTFIEHINGAGESETIYDEPEWNAGFRDAPPVRTWPLEAPMVFEIGDKLRVNCDWVNTTDKDLHFPNEMCVSLMVYYPALPEGFVVCD